MRHHVHTRVIPLYELSIMPNDVANARSSYIFRFAIFCKHILNSLSLTQETALSNSKFSRETSLAYKLCSPLNESGRLFRTGHNSVNPFWLARRPFFRGA